MAIQPGNPIEFRAPPPSPISAFKIGLENEETLDEFLRRSLHVPALILPYHLFPKEEFGRDPPEIDFAALALLEDRSVSDMLRSAEIKGCFQLVNHGVPKEVIGAIQEATSEFFALPAERKSALSRSQASRSGYEEFSGDGSPITEELFWSGDEKKVISNVMCSVWPEGSQGYKNFRRLMKRLAKETEGITSRLLRILREKARISEPLATAHEGTTDPVFCFYRHHLESQDSQKSQSHSQADVLRLLIRRSDFSHALCVNFPTESSEFRVYSKRGWTSFIPNKEAVIVTIGDQIQKSSKGRYKHVVGRSMLSSKDQSRGHVSVALLYSSSPCPPPFISAPHGCHVSDHHACERTITIRQQMTFVLYLILIYHLLNFIKQVV